MNAADRAKPWFIQATSDLRVAEALLHAPPPLRNGDVGCHATAMCSQAVEKSIKGYVIVNGATPSMDHRPDKYLGELLMKDAPLLRYKDHHRHLARLFDATTKAVVEQLLDLTPGGLGHRDDAPNTEYPWKETGEWRHTPYGASSIFTEHKAWLRIARRVLDMLHKLAIAAEQGKKL